MIENTLRCDEIGKYDWHDTDEELPRKRVALCFDCNILNGFMTE